MAKIHLISHTHWDREWYQPFQLFRIRLVHLIDKLLEILKNDPAYSHFMLDGQTIILEDYLEIRPEKEADLKEFIRQGRILIGPWYILPDEFLVSPEATIRNLLRGKKLCEEFGNRMLVGYLPDPFGHISQMPQILKGFSINTACLRRGLSDEPCELWWQSPDGSQVLLSYLKNGYDNASYLPSERKSFTLELEKNINAIRMDAKSDQILLMNGTDHQEPIPETPACIVQAIKDLGNDLIIHSTLPQYFLALQKEISLGLLIPETVSGELRDCKRHHLLPGVLSTRMWIKQRNHQCENLLEHWAEPFSAWANYLENHKHVRNHSTAFISNHLQGLINNAWIQLMKCHPHDSICGCSIDQVHKEMRSRFDQVEQVAKEVTKQSIVFLANQIDTRNQTIKNPLFAVTVFNPSPFPQTGMVEVGFPSINLDSGYLILDNNQRSMASEVITIPSTLLVHSTLKPRDILEIINSIHDGQIFGFHLLYIDLSNFHDRSEISLVMTDDVPIMKYEVDSAITQLRNLIEEKPDKSFEVDVLSAPKHVLRFVVEQISAFGYRTYWIQANKRTQPDEIRQTSTGTIENEFIKVVLDSPSGKLNIIDKKSQYTFENILNFMDGGDCGDEYNYNPPETDVSIIPEIIGHKEEKSNVCQIMELVYNLELPDSVDALGKFRSTSKVECPLVTRIKLHNGSPLVDFEVFLNNQAHDHRFQAIISTGLSSVKAITDGHFDILDREIKPELDFKDDWVEQPRREIPQRLFADISSPDRGVTLVNSGLPEVEFHHDKNGDAEISLTLLRCVGWLSRADLELRKNAAGPIIPTPGAQEIGEHTFRFALILHNGNWRSNLASAYGFDNPLRANINSIHIGSLESNGSIFQIDNPNFLITAIKQAEKGKGVILRGYNSLNEKISVGVTTSLPCSLAQKVNLDETLPVSDSIFPPNKIALELNPKEILTLLFT